MKKDRQPSTSSLSKAHSRGSVARLLVESQECNGLVTSKKNRSLLYQLCQLLVFSFRLVTPFSYLYLILIYFFPISPERYPFGWVGYLTLLLWTISEALFLPYYCYKFQELNSPNDSLPHLAIDQESRMQLVRQCFDAMGQSSIGDDQATSMEVHLQHVLEGWFLDHPISTIHYGNLAAWTGWAFFGKNVTQMTPEELTHNAEIIAHVETRLAWKFTPGYNPDIHALRLNLDPVFATQRPFITYATIFLINTATHFLLQSLLGFQLRPQFTTPSGSQAIYHRMGTDRQAVPIVFVHGIGIGFAHYLPLIWGLPYDRDVFLVEWPYVAMQMHAQGPSPVESVAAVTSCLAHYEHVQGACFVAHSLGTALVSWMLHDSHPDKPQGGAKAVHSAVLLDPITFLLCHPKVASVFVYKDPQGDNSLDLLMHYFVSRYTPLITSSYLMLTDTI